MIEALAVLLITALVEYIRRHKSILAPVKSQIAVVLISACLITFAGTFTIYSYFLDERLKKHQDTISIKNTIIEQKDAIIMDLERKISEQEMGRIELETSTKLASDNDRPCVPAIDIKGIPTDSSFKNITNYGCGAAISAEGLENSKIENVKKVEP